jgi:hypothetical protein
MIRRSAGRATNRRQKNSGREVCTPCRSRLGSSHRGYHRAQAFGEYGDQLVAEIEKKIAEEVDR